MSLSSIMWRRSGAGLVGGKAERRPRAGWGLDDPDLNPARVIHGSERITVQNVLVCHEPVIGRTLSPSQGTALPIREVLATLRVILLGTADDRLRASTCRVIAQPP